MSKISVVTAFTGGSKQLIEHENINPDVSFVAFTDCAVESKPWTHRPAYNRFKSPRRNSRIHKILIHQFISSEYSIWMDSSVRMNVPAEQVVDEWLKHHDIAMFRHPERDCIYKAIDICKSINKEGEIAALEEQGAIYRASGYPEVQGLCEAGVFVRRHNAITEMVNNYWWSEYCRFSSRDQVALMYVLNKLAIKVNVIEPSSPKTFENRWGNTYFSYIG